MIVKGKYIRFYVKDDESNKTVVYHSTNLDFEFGSEVETTITKDGTVKDQSGRSISGSGDALFVDGAESTGSNFKLLFDAWNSDEEIEAEIGVPDSYTEYEGMMTITFTGKITSLSVGAPAEGKATLNYAFEGSEPVVTFDTITPPGDDN